MGAVSPEDIAYRRKWIKFGLWSILLFILISCQTASKPEKQVFITNTGTKFHLESCRHLKFSRHMVTLDSAIAGGFTPCKVCRPLHDHSDDDPQKTLKATIPARQLSKAIRCTANKIHGIQCKRMTKNASGKCWQHEN